MHGGALFVTAEGILSPLLDLIGLRAGLSRRAALGAIPGLFADSRQVNAERSQSASFRRGVSLSSWFANSPRQPLFERDFAQIASAGFDHVRLPIDPELIGYRLVRSPGMPDSNPVLSRWVEVDKAIELAVRHGLSVIVDLHPEDKFQARLESEPQVANNLVACAKRAAQRYKALPPDRFAFEALNEPQFYRAPAAYRLLADRLVAAVRSVLPQHSILVGGPRGNSLEGLLALSPLNDPNLIYTFHFYRPFIVTHQGINVGFETSEVPRFHGVPYPASRLDPAVDYAPGALNPARARREIRAYRDQDWGSKRIRALLQLAADWATANGGVRLMCTEFGVYRPFIDPDSRYRWIRDVRRALEELGIGWTVWDYADVFGITEAVGLTASNPVDRSVTLVDPEHGEHRLEPKALVALGLREG
jgi:endoglucanase